MSQFRINRKVIEQIHIDSTPKADGRQRSVALSVAEWEGSNPPDLQTGSNFFISVSDITHDTRFRVTQFRVQPVRDAVGFGLVSDAKSPAPDILKVHVGKVKNHNDFEHDLIASELGRSESAMKLHVYDRILNAKNNTIPMDRHDWDALLADQPLKQITDPDHPKRWNCGAALNQFGTSYFGADHYRNATTRLYKPFVSKSGPLNNKMSDIQFDLDAVQRSVDNIRHLLSRKTAVTVFVVHHDGFTANGGIILESGKTHYLTIVGCNAAGTLFLCTDTWPGGSRLMYTSGIQGNVDSAFMGILKFDRNAKSIFTPPGQRGAHDYLVLTGP